MPQERWRSPSSLSEQELRRMQQDAQKRVERMRRQANEAISRRPEPQKPLPKPPEQKQNDPLAPVRAFLQDEERLMLLILLYLLYREKADPALLLALVYLIM